MKAWISSNFCQIKPLTMELTALKHLKINYNVVNTLVPSFLIGFCSYFAGNKDSNKFSDMFKI